MPACKRATLRLAVSGESLTHIATAVYTELTHLLRSKEGDDSELPADAEADCAQIALEVSRSLSGFGFWPRIVLHPGCSQSSASDDSFSSEERDIAPFNLGTRGDLEAESGQCQSDELGLRPIVVCARGINGDSARSHWQTVFPLLAARPAPVQSGDLLRIEFNSTLLECVSMPAKYSIRVHRIGTSTNR
eukprot:scaffold290973_cov36-Tisochrysis_lutea.AAC.2